MGMFVALLNIIENRYTHSVIHTATATPMPCYRLP
jgi:hypothetical protein